MNERTIDSHETDAPSTPSAASTAIEPMLNSGNWAEVVVRLRRAEAKRQTLASRLAEPLELPLSASLDSTAQRWLIPATAAVTVGAVSALANGTVFAASVAGIMAGMCTAVAHESVRRVALSSEPAAVAPPTLGVALVPLMTCLGAVLGLMGGWGGLQSSGQRVGGVLSAGLGSQTPWFGAAVLLIGAVAVSGLCFGVLASVTHHRWSACFRARATRARRGSEVAALQLAVSALDAEILRLRAHGVACTQLGLWPLVGAVAGPREVGAMSFEGRH